MQNIFQFYKILDFNQKLSSGFTVFVIEILFLIHLFQISNSIFQIALSIIIFQSLLFLSLYDIKKFEIPIRFVDFLILFFVIINFSLGIINSFDTNILQMGTNPQHNFLGALVGGIFILSIVLITKGNGMGLGDVRVIILLGLIFGLDRLAIGFYSTLMISLVFALIVFIFKRKIRGVMIPFVPFLVIGILFTFTFGLTTSILIPYM